MTSPSTSLRYRSCPTGATRTTPVCTASECTGRPRTLEDVRRRPRTLEDVWRRPRTLALEDVLRHPRSSEDAAESTRYLMH